MKKAIVLAAGKGMRMRSDLPKVLFPICGKPIVEYVLDALEAAGVEETIVVVGYRAELVREALKARSNVRFVTQTELKGTGSAVIACREELQNFDGPVFVIAGDSPALQSETAKTLFEKFEENAGASCVIGTVRKDNPFGMGRILRDEKGDFLGIVEERDATEEQRAIKEINMSYYLFNAPDLLDALAELRNNNDQEEYYITDVPQIMRGKGKKIVALPILKEIESLGVNTVDDLKIVEEALKEA